jgi:peptidase M48-like protein
MPRFTVLAARDGEDAGVEVYMGPLQPKLLSPPHPGMKRHYDLIPVLKWTHDFELGSLAAGATLASFNRDQETEADLIGLHLLNAAEYDPREAVKVMKKFIELRNLHGASLPLFATHTDPEVRLTNIQQWLGSLGEIDYSKRLVTTQECIEFKDTYRY